MHEELSKMSSDHVTPAASRITPPFTLATARAKVSAAENAWNSRGPETVAQAYTEDSDWWNRTEFLQGPRSDQVVPEARWEKELDYRLMKEL